MYVGLIKLSPNPELTTIVTNGERERSVSDAKYFRNLSPCSDRSFHGCREFRSGYGFYQRQEAV
ncbi:hypothetical protein ES703_55472 [subsurface metagenome]